MNPPPISDDGPDGGVPSVGEHLMLGVLRLASLPFLLLAIGMAAAIYGVAILARRAASLASCVHRAPGAARTWGPPASPQDA